jgi:hypothetical protein
MPADSQDPPLTAAAPQHEPERLELSPEILEEFKIVMENAAALSTRRQAINDVFVAINSIFLSGIGVLVATSHLASWNTVGILAALSLAILPINLTWRRMLATYRQLLADHYAALQAMEARFQFSANINTVLSKRQSTTQMERGLATYFALLYPALAVVVGVLTYLKTNHLIPPISFG